jgi:hypothetical protein
MEQEQRNRDQRKVYAAYRMSMAVERLILSTDPTTKQRAAFWIIAWAMVVRNRRGPQYMLRRTP